MVGEMQEALRKVYFSPGETRDVGYIETEHFGVRFPHRSSYVDLTCISQRWLRDLLWDHIADVLRSPSCPRSAQPVDYQRRAGAELSAFLEAEAPDGGHDPRALREEHAHRFVADLRNRERLGLGFRGQARLDGKKSTVTENMRRMMLNYGRAVLRGALDNGGAERIGLNRAFITAVPVGGPGTPRRRNPFPDEVARALADESNLRQLAEDHDPHDRGLRDMWEAIIITGRRANEVIQLHLDCIGRYGGLPVLWHDQTKVGNLNAAVRIPDRLMDRLEERRRKTLAHFADRHMRPRAHPRRARPPGPVPDRHAQPGRPSRPVLHLVPYRPAQLDHRPRPGRPLRRPPSPAYPGDPAAAGRGEPDAHPPIYGAGQ